MVARLIEHGSGEVDEHPCIWTAELNLSSIDHAEHDLGEHLLGWGGSELFHVLMGLVLGGRLAGVGLAGFGHAAYRNAVTNPAMPRALVNAAAIPAPWISALPSLIAQLADRWSLEVGDPYQPGGMTSWVAPVVDGSGRDLVLKITYPGVESRDEATGLRVWSGDGSVRLYDAVIDERYVALLLERCVPGATLKATASGEEQDQILAGLLARLWRHTPGDAEFRPLQDMCDFWADEFETKLTARPGFVDAGLAREGMDLFRGLPSSAPSSVLLVTDLHAENIVSAEREPWLMIDPKPYVGDRHYDALQHLLNDPPRLQRDPLGWAARMAGLLDLDMHRLRLWLFARCVQESFTWPYLRDVARTIAP